MKRVFEITYTDPETEQEVVVVEEFEDTDSEITGPLFDKPKKIKISAREWAEDYAYMLADKGPHTVREIK